MPKIRLLGLRRTLIAIIITGGIFSFGYILGSKGYQASIEKEDSYNVSISRELPAERKDLEFSLFWRVWETLETKYFDKDKLIPSKMIYGAIKGMVAAVGDPYTVFLPPSENKVVQEDLQGSFEGVGMEIGLRDRILTVISPLKGTPAEAAGLMPGDKIIKVDETTTYDISLNEAVSLIRGEKGTIVKLTVIREGVDETLEIEVVRDVIEIPIINTELRDDGIFIIELYSFSETSTELFQKALGEFKGTGSDKLILDLRNNPGGYLEASVDIASWFLPSGCSVMPRLLSSTSQHVASTWGPSTRSTCCSMNWQPRVKRLS